jgi:hypothetical protein
MFFLWLSVPEEVRQAQAATVGLHEGAQAWQRLHAEYSANTLVFRAAIAFLVVDAAPQTRARLGAFLDRPVEAMKGLDPSSDFAASVRKAAADLKGLVVGW